MEAGTTNEITENKRRMAMVNKTIVVLITWPVQERRTVSRLDILSSIVWENRVLTYHSLVRP